MLISRRLDTHLPVKIFGNFMHPAIVKKFFSGLMLIFPSMIMSAIYARLASFNSRFHADKTVSDFQVADTLVWSHLDYCNSPFKNLSSFNMRKLQRIENTLARIVTSCNRYRQVSPILQQLHWLPVEFCLIFRPATLIYMFLYSDHPSYFDPL